MLRFRALRLFFAPLGVVLACGHDPSQFEQSGGDLPPPNDPALKGPVLHHILSTGQSNSVGFAAKPPLTKDQPFTNLMFDVGVMSVAE